MFTFFIIHLKYYFLVRKKETLTTSIQFLIASQTPIQRMFYIQTQT